MNTTIFNILSNVIARIWSIGIGILLIPIYTNIIGMEAYGLVGFYGTLLGSLGILDLGLSSTLSRELARSKATNISDESVRNLVFSLECVYWIIGILLGLVIIIISPYITAYWINTEQLPPEVVKKVVALMGVIIAFQWPQSIYTGGLMGLQKQVSYNIVTVIFSTLKSVGVILVLKYISSSVISFFIWQLAISILTVLILRWILWNFLPKLKKNPSFSSIELKRIWRFAAGMTGISLATFCLSQIDKIVLSKILSLEDYGYYTLAWTVGTSVLLIVSILGNVLLPKITEVVAHNDRQPIIDTFHKYNKLMASVVAPAGLFLVVFSEEIMAIWTQNPTTTDNIWLAVSILTLGSLCNAFMHIPYYLMLAYGRTKFTIYQNIIASIILTPLLFWWTNLWGLTGATLVWFCVNFGYNIISLPILHNYLPILHGELKKTYLQDMLLPILISILLLIIAKIGFSNQWFWIIQALYFTILISIMYVLIVLSDKEYKSISINFLQKIGR